MDTIDYQKQAEDFLTKTETKFEVKLLGHMPYFEGDKEARDVYQITFTRKDKKPFVFRFGQSLFNSGVADTSRCRVMYEVDKAKEEAKKNRKKPTAYDVLAGITKYDPETFVDFCANFGYDEDSRKAEKVYFAVQKEWKEVCRLWNEKEREELQKIN